MQYHFKIYREKDGFWGECLELDGCSSQAETMEELMSNMQDALNLYLSEPYNSKVEFPLPIEKKIKKSNIVKVKVHPSVAFAFLLRMTRLRKKMTIKKMAMFLNYKNTNSYIKLEKAQTSNPELRTLGNILSKIPDFPIGSVF